MRKILEDLLTHAFVGFVVVAVSIVLLGELVGAPLELSPVEWTLALGAGASLCIPGYVIGLYHYRRRKELIPFPLKEEGVEKGRR